MNVNMNGVRNKVINKLLAVLLSLAIIFVVATVTVPIINCDWFTLEWLVANFDWVWPGWILFAALPVIATSGCMEASKMYLGDKPKTYWKEVNKTAKKRTRMCLVNWLISLVCLLASFGAGILATKELYMVLGKILESKYGMLENDILMALVSLAIMGDGVLLVELVCGILIQWTCDFFGWIKTPEE